MSKILFFGDIYGKLGRQGLAQVLPQWRKQYAPDVVIVNVENMAHGKGVTPATMAEMSALGIDAFTSGNHVFHSATQAEACFTQYPNLIRPQNYGPEFPGKGYYRFEKNGQWYCILNLNGTTFFEKQFRGDISSPFTAVDSLLSEVAQKGDIILIDLHAEATSEKVAFGWHVDGRATVVVGTHTHVPTADQWIMPAGTAFTCDVGMTGPRHSVIGVIIENSLGRFLDPANRYPMEPADDGPVVVNAVLITTDGVKAKSIQRLQQVL